jgi:hypothetical protein
MKRTLVGAGLLVAAGIGSVAMAPGGAAQEGEPTWEQLEAHFEPNPAEPGQTVTLVPDQPCTFDVDDEHVSEPGEVVIFLGDEEVSVEMDEDGFWSFEIEAPAEPGTYTLTAECRNSTYGEEQRWCEVDDDHHAPEATEGESSFDAQNISYSRPVVPTWKWFDCKFQYYEADLTVGGDEGPSPTTTVVETPPAETPPPATPVVTPPDFTG